jgi:hypothetical protein
MFKAFNHSCIVTFEVQLSRKKQVFDTKVEDERISLSRVFIDIDVKPPKSMVSTN